METRRNTSSIGVHYFGMDSSLLAKLTVFFKKKANNSIVRRMCIDSDVAGTPILFLMRSSE
jgi:hypothetical protein